MKRISLILVAALLFSACGTSANLETSSDVSSSSEQDESADEGAIDVDKGEEDVTLTLPATFFGDQTEEEVLATVDGEILEITANDDGSYTYVISKAQHDEMLQEMKESIVTTISEIEANEDLPSIKKIEANEAFTEIKVTVDKAAYESSFDSFALLGVQMSALMYQVFAGVDQESLLVTIDLIDESTGETFDTAIYPQDEVE